MDKPVLTKWDEKKLDELEEFVVFKPTRIDPNDGKGCRAFKKGEKVKVKGFVKKDLYFQNKIMLEKDFAAVVAYEKEQKASYSAVPDVNKDSADASQKAALGKK